MKRQTPAQNKLVGVLFYEFDDMEAAQERQDTIFAKARQKQE